LKIKKIITGSLEENCYLIIKDNDCLVIDPGDDFYKIKEEIKDLNLLAILITHHHFDHVGALLELLDYKNVKIYDYKQEEKEYEINKFKFNIIKTPGHTNDSVTFYFKEEKTMFTGDFIFRDTIGRTDLPTGDIEVMEKSIEKIRKYDKDITLYPGHGDKTTLDYEINNNYFFT